MRLHLKMGYLILMILFSIVAFGQKAAIEGTAIGEDGRPLKGVWIKIDRTDAPGAFRVKSGSSGQYFHDGLPVGTYNVTLESNRKPLATFTGIQARSGAPTPVNFDLSLTQLAVQPEPPRAVELSDPEPYAGNQRIQISEPCPSVAKWIAQILSTGPHFRLLSYEQDLGILTFKVSGGGNLTRADLRSGNQIVYDRSARNVRADMYVFTLRSLVSSIVSFGNAAPSAASSCTIAVGVKYVSTDGKAWVSSGKEEAFLLNRIKSVYAQRGLSY